MVLKQGSVRIQNSQIRIPPYFTLYYYLLDTFILKMSI